ncbi:hypothetical protein RJ639_007724 [Escallonia herrerae]|uniref:Uncharacterized protein n=1 Tax=Escallonia herrerae TaxID=1293975 RepID=A0AA88W3K1_9ASTE|nr:hypothetical protein RJ639_007724 [Escallonia herrerae]
MLVMIRQMDFMGHSMLPVCLT